jgi:DNA-binding response OmpR family regulator
MQLLDRVQDHAYPGYERTIDVHIMSLRKKLGDDSQPPRFLETVRGVGYRFCQE